MSHQKQQVSGRDYHCFERQAKHQHDADTSSHIPSETIQPAKRAKHHKKHHNVIDLKDSHIYENNHPSHSHSHKKHKHHHRVTNDERRIITQKLEEIDALRSKIVELQHALSSHEEMCTNNKSFTKKTSSSSCFSCLKRTSNKMSPPAEEIFEIFPRNNACFDQISTEAVMNSTPDSTVVVHDRPKHYKRRRKVKKCQFPSATDKNNNNNNNRKHQPHRDHKITNNNTIVLPESFSSCKTSSEEIHYLTAKLEKQTNEIKAIKVSLEECLNLLRNKGIGIGTERNTCTIQNTLKKKSLILDDYIYVNRLVSNTNCNAFTNFVNERKEVVNLMPICQCGPDPDLEEIEDVDSVDNKLLLTVTAAQRKRRSSSKRRKKTEVIEIACSEAKCLDPRSKVVCTATSYDDVSVQHVINKCYQKELVMKVSPLAAHNIPNIGKSRKSFLCRRKKVDPIYNLDLLGADGGAGGVKGKRQQPMCNCKENSSRKCPRRRNCFLRCLLWFCCRNL